MEIKEKIRKYLSRSIRNHELADDENIFEKGLVNSLFSMQLLLFVEKEFDLELEYEDLSLEHVKSVNAIAELVEQNLNKEK